MKRQLSKMLSSYLDNNKIPILLHTLSTAFVFLRHFSSSVYSFFISRLCLALLVLLVLLLCFFLWLSKLLVSVFSNDRICCMLRSGDSFSPFRSRIISRSPSLCVFFHLLVSFQFFLLGSFVRSFFLAFIHACFNFMLLFELNTFGFALSIFFFRVRSILCFHSVLCV